MRTRILVVALVLNCVALVGAQANTPRLSGTYIFRMSQHCQPFGIHLDRAENELTIVTFHSNTHRVQINGFSDFGTVVQTSPVMKHVTVNMTDTFSNTATTFTLGLDTYEAIYADVTNTGVAKEVYFQGRPDHKHCTAGGSAVFKN